MKIIEIFNKIANGEEVPEKIKYKNKEWLYNDNNKDYCRVSASFIYWFSCSIFDTDEPTKEILNDEIEIISEPKKIEKITEDVFFDMKEVLPDGSIKIPFLNKIDTMMIDKINELIDKLNEMENK